MTDTESIDQAESLDSTPIDEPSMEAILKAVSVLRSPNATVEEAQEAMDTLFGDDEHGAFLIRIGALTMTRVSTPRVNAQLMFVQMLMVAQGLGDHLGMKLNWVDQQMDPGGIAPPPGGMIRA